MSPSILLGRRTRAMRLVLVVVFVALVVRLVSVQEFSHQHYASLSASELTQTVTVPAVRGGIYDRNGEVLAESVTKQTVVADPLLITHPAAIAAALSPVLGIPTDQLRAELTEHSGFVYLAHRVPDAVAAKVTALEPDRHQPGARVPAGEPDGQLALPVVGYGRLERERGRRASSTSTRAMLAGQAGTKSLMRGARTGWPCPERQRPRRRPSPGPGSS